MKPNPYLKNAVIEVVENQLRDNNPKATRETFKRLTAAGYDESTAKEMIAVVVIESVYETMKYKKHLMRRNLQKVYLS